MQHALAARGLALLLPSDTGGTRSRTVYGTMADAERERDDLKRDPVKQEDDSDEDMPLSVVQSQASDSDSDVPISQQTSVRGDIHEEHDGDEDHDEGDEEDDSDDEEDEAEEEDDDEEGDAPLAGKKRKRSNRKSSSQRSKSDIEGGGEQRWTTLIHKGPKFPDPYTPLPKDVMLKYDGMYKDPCAHVRTSCATPA